MPSQLDSNEEAFPDDVDMMIVLFGRHLRIYVTFQKLNVDSKTNSSGTRILLYILVLSLDYVFI